MHDIHYLAHTVYAQRKLPSPYLRGSGVLARRGGKCTMRKAQAGLVWSGLRVPASAYIARLGHDGDDGHDGVGGNLGDNFAECFEVISTRRWTGSRACRIFGTVPHFEIDVWWSMPGKGERYRVDIESGPEIVIELKPIVKSTSNTTFSANVTGQGFYIEFGDFSNKMEAKPPSIPVSPIEEPFQSSKASRLRRRGSGYVRHVRRKPAQSSACYMQRCTQWQSHAMVWVKT
ncbi:hypothetical protein B0T13DRAFT_447130 [Neurospora crassa]|nr:hypothetical protein B0T13DRAFT_447130 [Neurospora crassa]